MNKILSFKKIVSLGIAVFAMVAFFGVVKAETTYKWVNNGSATKSDSRKTGDCSTKKQVTTYTCGSSTKGNKLYDGTNKGSSYGDTGHAWPIYEGENTSTATEYTYNSDNCTETVHKESGTVNEWECKSSDSTTNSSSSSSSSSTNSNSSSSASSVSTPTVTTGSATNITSNSATISATINNGGASSVDAYLYYAKSGDSSWTQAIGKTLSGSGDQDLSANITGLSAGTKYYYQAYARNRNNTGDKNGSKKSFTTSGSSSSVSSGASSSSSSVQQYTLKVKISGAGEITSSGGSSVINCKKSIDSKGKSETSGDCSVKFNKGESVTLTVSTPSTKYEFATWADACRSSQKLSSCAVVMNGDKTVSATFNKINAKSNQESSVTVSVRKTGNGVGKVVSIVSAGKNSGKEDGAINCGSNCSENYRTVCEGNENGGKTCGTAYFRAVAEKGSTFGGWGGDCATFKNEKDQCYVNLDGEKNITAKFNEGSNNPNGKYFDLTVTASSGGVVKSEDGKINCGSGNTDCSHSYGKNGTVTLKATPNSGYTFQNANSNWGNCDKMTGNDSCQVKMTKNQTLTVNFKASGTTSSSSSSSSTSANITATTGSVTNLTSTSATLNGTVNSNGENVAYIFSYYKKGTSEVFWKYTSWKSVSGSGEVSASADITGLSSGASYYYILQAYSYTNKKTVNGGGKSFTTSGGSSSSSSSTSSSASGSASVDLKAREVKTGSAFGDYSDSLTLNNANSGGNESIDLKWTVSGVSSCSLSYDSNAKHFKSSVTSGDLIVSSGDTRYNTEDYVVNSSSRQTATYTLTCKDSNGNSKSDSVSVTY